MATLSLQEARDAVAQALRRAGANETMAAATARALVLAEAQGLDLVEVAPMATPPGVRLMAR